MRGSLQLWLAARRNRREPMVAALGIRHVMVCVCERRETVAGRCGRIERHEEFAHYGEESRDADGFGPRHTFFEPLEESAPERLDALAELCRATGSETALLAASPSAGTPLNLHALSRATDCFASHGLLSSEAGEIRYALLGAGAWSRLVQAGELKQSGCYAAFVRHSVAKIPPRALNSPCYTRGSGPDESLPEVRRIYSDRENRPSGPDELLIIPPPLTLDRERRSWGLFSGVEAGELTPGNPPTVRRMRLWLDCRFSVEGRPNWLFVTLHVARASAEGPLSPALRMREFYQSLSGWMQADSSLRFHYVTAREMVNILHAAEAGHSGDPRRFRNSRLASPLDHSCPR